jgi:hypothetical protein
MKLCTFLGVAVFLVTPSLVADPVRAGDEARKKPSEPPKTADA